MKQSSDFERIDAALKRAAYRAVHGTREERSGRFLPAKRDDALPGRRASKQAGTKRRKA
jgi:hypothetical protein